MLGRVQKGSDGEGIYCHVKDSASKGIDSPAMLNFRITSQASDKQSKLYN